MLDAGCDVIGAAVGFGVLQVEIFGAGRRVEGEVAVVFVSAFSRRL